MSKITLTLNIDPLLDVKKMNVLIRELKNSMGPLGKDFKVLDEVKIGKEFDKIATQARKAEQEANKLKTGVQSVDDALKKSSGSAGVFAKAFQFNQITQSMQTLVSAMSPFLNSFVEMDKQVQNIGTLGVKNLGEISGALSDMAIEIPGDAAVLGNALYQAISAGTVKAKDGILDIPGAVKFVGTAAKDAVSGLSDSATAVNLYTSVLNAYGKTAEDVGEVSNATFASIKLGKTTFEELSGSTATWLPMAANAKIGMDEVFNSIARMTSMGTPTSIAATQLRAAMVLIQKGSGPLNKALKKSGTSLEELQKKMAAPVSGGGGLVNVLEIVRKSVEDAGLTLPQATGRIEAANAILNLTGANLKGTQEQYATFRTEVERGVATEAFDAASQSIASKTDSYLSTIQAYFNKAFTAIGSGGVTAFNTLNQLSPALISMSTAGPLLAGGFKQLAVSLLTKTIPAVVTTDAVTKATTISMKALSKALLTNPFAIAAVAAVALTVALVALHKSQLEVAQEEVETAKKEERAVAAKIKINKANQDIAKSNVKLLDEFKKLGKEEENAAEHSDRYNQVLRELAKSYPDVIDESKPYSENVKALEQSMGKLTDEQEKHRQHNIALIDEYESLGNKSERTKEEQARYEEIIEQLNKQYPGIIGFTGDFSQEINTLRRESGYATQELEKLRSKMQDFSKEQKTASFNTMKKQAFESFAAISDKIKDTLTGKAESDALRFLDIFRQMLKSAQSDKEIEALKTKMENAFAIGKGTDFTKVIDQYWKNLNEKQRGQWIANAGTAERAQQTLLLRLKNGAEAIRGISSEELDSISKLVDKYVSGMSGILDVKSGGVGDKLKLFLGQWAVELKKVNKQTNFDELQENFNRSLYAAISGDSVKAKEARATATAEFEKMLAEVRTSLDTLVEPDGTPDKTEATSLANDIRKERLKLNKTQEETKDLLAKDNDTNTLKRNQKSLNNEIKSIESNMKAIEKATDKTEEEKYKLLEENGLRLIEKRKALAKAEQLLNDQIAEEKRVKAAKAAQDEYDTTLVELENKINDVKSKEKVSETERNQLLRILSEEKIAIEKNRDAKIQAATDEFQQTQTDNEQIYTDQINEIDEQGLAQSNEVFKKAYERRLSLLIKRLDLEIEKVIDRYEKERALQEQIIEQSEAGYQSSIESQKEKEIARLDALKEKEKISEEKYNKEKEKIEREHQSRLLVIEASTQGARLEAERQFTVAILKEKQKRIKAELAETDKTKDPEKYKELSDALTQIDADISDKGDVLKAHSETIKSSISQIFGSLFETDKDAVKAPIKEVLGVVAGGLKQYASAIATQLVFGEIAKYSSTGVFALLLIPAFQAIVNAALGKILDPLFSSIASFATGGRVDSPTLFYAGDAANARPGNNTEWIVRDIDISTLINKAIQDFVSDFFPKMDTTLKDYFTTAGFTSAREADWTKELSKIQTNTDKLKARYELTDETLADFTQDYKNYQNAGREFYQGKITQADYVQRTQSVTPEMRYLQPEVTIDAVQFAKAVNDAFDKVGSRLEKKMDLIISAITKQNFTVNLNSRVLAESVNNENLKLSKHVRTK